MAASRPTPQTQNRGRRRVCLGLLGTFIAPEATAPRLSGQNMPPPRSIPCHACLPLSALDHTDLFLFFCFKMYLTDAILASGLMCATQGVFDWFGLTSAAQHPAAVGQSVSPSATSTSAGSNSQQASRNNESSTRSATRRQCDPRRRHIPPALNVIPATWSPVWVEVFSWSLREDHQGAPSAGWGDWRGWRASSGECHLEM